MSNFKKLFLYKGRISRRKFWLYYLVPVTVLSAAVYSLPERYTIGGWIPLIGFALLFWLATAGVTKRLHDRGRLGGLQAIFIVPAFGLYILSAIYSTQVWLAAAALVTALIGLWILVETCFIAGTLGLNRFGDEPISYAKVADTAPPEIDEEPIPVVSTEPEVLPQDIETHEPPARQPNMNKQISTAVLEGWLNGEDQEHLPIIKPTYEKPRPEPMPEPTPMSTPEPEPALAQKTAPPQSKKRVEVDDQKSIYETERFLDDLRERATTDPAHTLYLAEGAEAGNSWSKLEIAATWLCDAASSRENTDLAMIYLRDLADAHESFLGAETEAAYFLGEIYRIGMRFTRPNEDLSAKYYVRAASLGHLGAQRGLARQIATALVQDDDQAKSFNLIQPIIVNALKDRESATALLHLIEFDWSLTYLTSIPNILKSLVDQGNGIAAKYLGRIALDNDNLDMALRVLIRADELDHYIIDKIMTVIQGGRGQDATLNALVDLLQTHADQGNAHAQHQIAFAYNQGIGRPQDDVLAYMYINMACAQVHGRERNELVRLRDDLKDLLSTDEISTAHKMIREQFNT